MPDRYGRVNASDWNAATAMIGGIQRISQRNETFNQQQADRVESKQLKNDANYNAGLYKPGAVELDEGSPYGSVDEARESAMRGNATAKAQGKIIAASALESEGQIATLMQDKAIKKGVAAHGEYLKKNGIEKYLSQNFEGDHRTNQQARTIVLDEYRKLDEVQKGIKAKRYKDLDERYTNVFHPTMTAIGTKIQGGDLEGAAHSFTALAKATQIPYELSDYDPKTGTLLKTYPASETGQHEPVERVGVVQLYEDLKGWGKQQYVEILDRAADATVESNLINRLNPIPVTGPKGKTFWLTSQKKVTNPSQINFSIRQDGSLEKQEFENWDALHKAHPFIRKEDLARKKELQQIATSKAAMDLSNKKNNGAAVEVGKKQLDLFNKQFGAYLEPFGGGGIQTNEAGEITMESLFNQAGKNSFNESQKFLYDHQADYKTLTGQDKLKFESARKADGLYRHMLNGFKSPEKANPASPPNPVKGAVYTPEAATAAGGKQLPDGRWVVPSDIPGKAKVIQVEESQGATSDMAQVEVEPDGSMEPGTAMQGGEPSSSNTDWDKTPLGKMENTVEGIPGFIKASNQANEDNYEVMKKKAMGGSSIPGVNTFRR